MKNILEGENFRKRTQKNVVFVVVVRIFFFNEISSLPLLLAT